MIVLATVALSMFYPGVFFRIPEVPTYEESKGPKVKMDFASRCQSCGRYLLSAV